MVPDHWSNDAMVSMDRRGLTTTIVFIINITTTVIIVLNISITIIAIDGIAGLFGATTTTAAPATDEEK